MAPATLHLRSWVCLELVTPECRQPHSQKGKSPAFGPTYGILRSTGKKQGKGFPSWAAPLLPHLFRGGS